MREVINILKSDLRNLYTDREMTTYKIADYYQCSQTKVWKLLHRYNILVRRPGNHIDIPRSILKKLYIDSQLSSRKIAKIYNCAYSTIDSKIRQCDFKIRNLAQAHIIYPRKNFSGDLAEKAYLIGFTIGDLRVRKIYKNSETISIDCASTYSQQIKLIKDLFESYGRVWISKSNKRGKRQIQAQLDLSFSFLLNLDGNIDNWILDNSECFFAFLAGFTDAEGSFFISNGQAFYSLGNYNKKILNQIYKKLIELGIFCLPPKSDNLKGYRDKQGYIRKQDYWTLRINRKQSLLRLFGLLEFYLRHEKKKADMEKAKINIIERNKKFGKFISTLNKI